MRFKLLDPEAVAAALRGDPDANGQPPERGVSDGSGNPCRCCLRFIDEGDPMLILAARPFGSMHPYAELGPVFLHADGCETWSGEGVPPVLTASPDYLMRGYDASERIVYGTGSIVPADDTPSVPPCCCPTNGSPSWTSVPRATIAGRRAWSEADKALPARGVFAFDAYGLHMARPKPRFPSRRG